MDGVHMRLTALFPSVLEIEAEAALRFPDRPHMQSDYTAAMCRVLYGETRQLVLEADERAARKYDPPEDDEDDTEDVDYGEPVARALPVDPEAVFPAAAAAPTLATDVTRREVKVCDRYA